MNWEENVGQKTSNLCPRSLIDEMHSHTHLDREKRLTRYRWKYNNGSINSSLSKVRLYL